MWRACGGPSDIRLMVGILSAAKNSDVRMAVRETWAADDRLYRYIVSSYSPVSHLLLLHYPLPHPLQCFSTSHRPSHCDGLSNTLSCCISLSRTFNVFPPPTPSHISSHCMPPSIHSLTTLSLLPSPYYVQSPLPHPLLLCSPTPAYFVPRVLVLFLFAFVLTFISKPFCELGLNHIDSVIACGSEGTPRIRSRWGTRGEVLLWESSSVFYGREGARRRGGEPIVVGDPLMSCRERGI